MAGEPELEALDASSDIAIVGMAGRFPGARNLESYWRLIASGQPGTIRRTREELVASGVSTELASHPDYVPVSGMLEDVEAFDAPFFDIGPRDAALMDPQHRHFLECCWEALEDAGHPPSKFGGSIGVYAGSGMNGYLIHNLLTNPEMTDSLGMFVVRHTSNDKDFLATGVSYKLNLRGPSVNVQTACSTSLVAIHLAAQSLLANECDMALAGGVTIEVPHGAGYLYRDGEILSQDGVCRAFDAQSSGTILTSGAGVVVLRRLGDALRDRDHIHAVIKATAINNDGAGKVGYLAPSVEGHAAVVIEAQELAGIEPESIQYVEAHGTGTPVGDPIEVAALTQAFRRSTRATGFARLGSAKPTVGHLDTAAGVASVIKTALALEHQSLPPMAGYTEPNPLLDLESTPFLLSGDTAPWPRGNEPRRAGISSLGVGGTNAHAILEEAPSSRPTPDRGGRRLLTLSARSAEALERARTRLADHLEHSGDALRDVAWTLQDGREEFAYRFAAPASGRNEAICALRHPVSAQPAAANAPSIVFMFPGGGSQYPNMGRGLYETEPAYRQAVDACFALMEPALGSAVRELLFPPAGFEEAAAEQFALPSVQLPAIFLTEYALAELWKSWGVQPAAMTGHSLGEYAAACIAGVIELKDALAIVALRGRIMERVPDAAMISINLPEPEVAGMLHGGLSLAAVNAPQLCVVSGENRSIEQLEVKLGSTDVANRRVKIVGAVHCHLLDPYLEEFRRFMAGVRLSPPTIPYISNVTGTWIKNTDACDPNYWVRHLRETVRFNDGLETLLEDPNRILVEVGPGTTLSALARQQTQRPAGVVSSLPHARDAVSDADFALQALGNVWKAGATIEWKLLYREETPSRVSLPTYPFERERHWIEPGRGRGQATAAADAREVGEWLSAPSWTRTPVLPVAGTTGGKWLVFLDDTGLGAEAIALLKANNEDVTVATLGGPESPFIRVSDRDFMVNPSSPDGYGQLFEQLAELERIPDRILHFGGVPHSSTPHLERADEYELNTDRGYFSAFELLKALANTAPEQQVHATFVTAGAATIEPTDRAVPEQAMIGAVARVASRENPGLSVSVLDVPASVRPRVWKKTQHAAQIKAQATQVVAHSAARVHGTVALRGEERWVESLSAMPSVVNADTSAVTVGGRYLVVGGTGGVGAELVRWLANTKKASIGVVARDAHAAASLEAEVRSAGGSFAFEAANVADPAALRAAINGIEQRLGQMDGLFYLAGTLDDAPMQVKERPDLERVLAPKVNGLFTLERSIDLTRLDFAVLFSSISARIAPAGQADYAAANAFVSAFAEHRRTCGDKHTVALEWSMWKQLGMVASEAPSIEGKSTLPPGEVVRCAGGETIREFVLSPETSWMLDEHRTAAGAAVLPGSAHVELLRMAAAADGGDVTSLSHVEFLQPLVCQKATLVRVRTRETGAACEVSLSSFQGAAGWVEHSRCTAGRTPLRADAPNVVQQPLEPSRATPAGSSVDQAGLLTFGPRWQNIRAQGFGRESGSAVFELGEAYRGDLDAFALHPALLDMATSFALGLVAHASAGAFVPASYDSVRIHRPLPARFNGHAVLKSSARDGSVATFDVTMTSDEGEPLVECTGVTFRLLGDLTALESRPAPTSQKPRTQLGALGERCGITAESGFAALELALARPGTSFVVSPVDPAKLDEAAEADAAGASAGVQVSRPQLKTNFEAPRDETETAIARIWSELLGLASVGVNDDFFELGGHSLIALRMFARLKEQFGLDLGLASLFETPTVAGLAAVIRGEVDSSYGDATGEGRTKRWPCLVPVKPTGTRPALFCVHGAKGNVLNFRELARRLPKDQPFYGLQLQGLNGVDPFHTTVDEMAAHYVSEVVSQQPDGPYYLGGFSGGGVVALEMARQLTEAGKAVALVLLFDSPAPGYDRMRAFPWFQLRNAESVLQYGPSYLWEKVKGRWNWWNWGKGRPSGISFNHFDAVLAGHEAAAFDGYTVLLRVKTRVYPADLGWNRWITRGIESHQVDGSHEGMWKPPYVDSLTRQVVAAIANADRNAAGR